MDIQSNSRVNIKAAKNLNAEKTKVGSNKTVGIESIGARSIES